MDGTTRRVSGRIKRVAGRITGNRSMQARGAVQETVGKAQRGLRRMRDSGQAAAYRGEHGLRGTRRTARSLGKGRPRRRIVR